METNKTFQNLMSLRKLFHTWTFKNISAE